MDFFLTSSFFFVSSQPVLVSCVHENMTSALWAPEGFAEEFGMY